MDQDRADDVHGHRVEDLRRPCARHLLGEDDLLLQGRPAAAVLARPLDPHPAGGRQLALPGTLERAPPLLVVGRRGAGEMGGEPVAQLAAECLLGGSVTQSEHPFVSSNRKTSAGARTPPPAVVPISLVLSAAAVVPTPRQHGSATPHGRAHARERGRLMRRQLSLATGLLLLATT